MKVKYISFILSCSFLIQLASLFPSSGFAKPKSTLDKATSVSTEYDGLLKKLEPLIKEQKFQAGLDLANREAEKITDPLDRARLLTKILQLENGLHDYETAIRNFKKKEWPADYRAQALLNIFYAHSLQQYYRAYAWEISQRTQVASAGKLNETKNLKSMTGLEIYGEAIASLNSIWSNREKLGTLPKDSFKEYIRANTYPEGVRDTLRDSYSLLFVGMLNDSSGWSPEQSNDLFRLNLQNLLRGADLRTLDLKDMKTHPLQKIAKIIFDLKAWHEQNRRLDAALDVQLQFLTILHERFTGERDRTAIQKKLADLLTSPAGKTPWYSMGAATLARFWMDTGSADSLVKALDLVKKGAEAFPNSLGAKSCRDLIQRIQAPHFELEAMKVDGQGKRSLALDYKNIKKIYLYSFKYDFKKFLQNSKDYYHYPEHRELASLWKSTPTVSWSMDLPSTTDFYEHKAFVTPPTHEPGFYVIFAATQPQLSSQENIVKSTMVFFSDLVITQTTQNGHADFELRNGNTGKLEPDVTLSIYRFDYSNKSALEATLKTDVNGRASFRSSLKVNGYAQYGVLAERKNNLSFAEFGLANVAKESQRNPHTVFYSDRSIYRPLQTIHWKIIAFAPEKEVGKYHVLAQAKRVVHLKDMNGQVVESKTVTTDEFGAAWGEFSIPMGRALGTWRLETDSQMHSVRVEEYKRPTFEIQWQAQKTATRLNHQVEIIGEAHYYFGSPLSSGRVRYTIERNLVFPWWCFWSRFSFQSLEKAQVIAAAETQVGTDGIFKIKFTPEADEQVNSLSQIKYNYTIKAEVLDEGGETRTAQTIVPVSTQSIEAFLSMPSSFVREDKPFAISLRRALIAGDPSPGQGTWKLVKLIEPRAAQMPADTAPPAYLKALGGKRLLFPDDEKQTRWKPSYNWQMLVRDWAEGDSIVQGSIETDAKGIGEIQIPRTLKAGAYRLLYKTKDSFDTNVESQTEFFVANEKYRPKLPGLFLTSQSQAKVGETIDLWMPSGLNDQTIIFEVFQDGKLIERRVLNSSQDHSLTKWTVKESMRGGLAFSVRLLNDFQSLEMAQSVFVPWDNKEIAVEFLRFRDKLQPGKDEKWTIKLTGPQKSKVKEGSVQLLAYMYDRSLDSLAPHFSPNLMSIFPTRSLASSSIPALGLAPAGALTSFPKYKTNEYVQPQEDFPIFLGGFAIGGPGRRGFGAKSFENFKMSPESARMRDADSLAPQAGEGTASLVALADKSSLAKVEKIKESIPTSISNASNANSSPSVRTNFSETAFFYPNLISGKNGEIEIKFQAPEAVTSWTLWLQGLTQDLKVVTATRQADTVKEIILRPYLPRFLREGDRAQLRFVLNNTSEKSVEGQIVVELLEEDGRTDVSSRFKVLTANLKKSFQLKAKSSLAHEVEISVPAGLGNLTVRAVATSGNLSDGELRSLPILPGRFHLAQSKFISLKDRQRKTLEFQDLKNNSDPSLVNEKLTVQVDAQLFYSVLSSLPYLISYPYECVEQTLNRFVSTGIMTSLFGKFPAIEKMAKEFSSRKTQFESFDEKNVNRSMALEETPWLNQAQGGIAANENLVNVLDSKIAAQHQRESLAKLEKAQTSLGAFPWFSGGPPSPYMTLYVVYGLSKALEFGVEAPKLVSQKAWSYLHQHYLDEDVRNCMTLGGCWEFVTFLNYVLSNYPDSDWGQKIFTEAERNSMLEFSFKHWKQHSPYLKGYLALTLARNLRQKDAALVWDSVMDSAKFSEEEGTHWAREDRSWLWYNDTIETHAFALRTLMEVGGDTSKRDGLVHWLFLNKKMNHWQSTRGTAEVIYALAHYLTKTKQLGLREAVNIKIGTQNPIDLEFLPEKYSGQKNQIVFEGAQVNSTLMPIALQKSTPGYMFASANWQFSTDKLPQSAVGDFLSVDRKYFIRDNTKKEVVLRPLSDGQQIRVGDEVEVQLSLKSKHPVDYVHLRDPRGAGFEPVGGISKHKWDLGLYWYEEIRDSGTNFFFENLPQGEYTFKYRIRATTAGDFKVSPATLQPMYAPEFSAYSAGQKIRIMKDGE